MKIGPPLPLSGARRLFGGYFLSNRGNSMDKRKRNRTFYFWGPFFLFFILQSAFAYQIDLNQGWNLISLPEQPANTAIEQVAASIRDKFSSIWAYMDGSWKLYDPQNPNFNDLLTMEAGRGYWVEMKESGALSGSGTAAPSSVLLSAGWNLAGYGCKPLAISSALASIAGKYDSVWTFKEGIWKLYDPNNPNFSDLTTLDPGVGYWINAKELTTWTCPDDYAPKPVVPGETTPESSGQVTVNKTSSNVSLSDGTQVSFQGMGEGSSITLTLERASNTIDIGNTDLATSGSMRILTVHTVAYNGTDYGSAFAPILTIPKKDIGSLNINFVNILRISTNPDTGEEIRDFFPVFEDENGNLAFRDWLLPTEILEEEAPSANMGNLFASGKKTYPNIIKYSPLTYQDQGNIKIPAQLVRMVEAPQDPAKGYPEKRKVFSEIIDEKEKKKPVQNVVIFVHGHNELEKKGLEKKDPLKGPWYYDYKRDVWNYMYGKFFSDYSDRKDCTVFYEFIYPSWRSIYWHLNSELARLVKAEFGTQLNYGMKFNLFIVAHSMGGVVSRAGL
jgi:hypothetical protein